MNDETQNLKWWEGILIVIFVFSMMCIITYVGNRTIEGYSERVTLRKLNILKTKHEILRLNCGTNGGELAESNWSVKCNN